MAYRNYKKLAVLSKIEDTYGTDATPQAADAIIGTNVQFNPMEGQEVERDLMLPYLGNQGLVLAGIYASLRMDVEIAGAGTAGDVPKYGSLLRACGMAETVTADTSVDYSFVDSGLESTSLYFVSDKVQHVLLGARGTLTHNFTAKGIPRFTFSMTGLLGTITDIGAMPAVTQAGWTRPLIVSKANTALSLHGWAGGVESLSIDHGGTVTPDFLINEENIEVTDRKATGTAVVRATDLATVNWFELAQARTRDALSLVQGTADGNIVELAAPAVEIGRPTQGQTNNRVNYSLPLGLCPVNGLDELTITVR
ncbi:phage tail tube protein [Acidimangrovimonas sediminis]|uniref:phage tail tube protein n=1 Tax=Acidimangrovimonas sediminis TaxID=2056283 RepID=UPI000C8095E8|nr:phage tail tube protein [Acidimangrovimonas sediminis]